MVESRRESRGKPIEIAENELRQFRMEGGVKKHLSLNFRGRHGGGGKKRGEENLTNDTPPKKGFWTPHRTVRFPPPSGVVALIFLYKNPRLSRPKALLEGSRLLREGAFSGTFSSPHTYVWHLACIMAQSDGGNHALVIGCRDQFRGLKNPIFKGISEPQTLS